MALKDTWTPKIDDIDDVMASDINEVAAAVIKIEEEGISGGGGGGMTEEQVREILADGIDFLNVKQLLTAYSLHIDGDLGHIVVSDGKGNRISLRDVIGTKSDKTNIVEGVSGATVTLAHNTEYRIGEMPATFEFFFPSNFDIDYISSVVFSTGSSVPQLKYPTDIRWNGDDVDKEFAPVASKHYTIVFWYDGTYLNGAVRGVDNE